MPQVAIVMPKMSMTMTEGELLTWHCKVGDQIKAGDVVCEVATDKIDMEVEATATGTVTQLIGNPGDVIDVGVPLIMVDAESDDLLAGIFDEPAAPVVETAPATAAVASPVIAPSAPVAAATPVAAPVNTGAILATPKARETARTSGVNLAYVVPTGTEGVITTPDVLGAARSHANAERSLDKRLKVRLAIAKAIAASADIPAFSMSFQQPVSRAKYSTAEYALAWAAALRRFPELHADWNNGSPQSFGEVKLAISVMAAHGVVTPSVVIPEVADASFARKLEDIISQAERGHVALEHLASSTSGFGVLTQWPVTAASGILIRPQSTSCAVGAPVKTDTGYALPVTITADHRLSDPADVALLAEAFGRSL